MDLPEPDNFYCFIDNAEQITERGWSIEAALSMTQQAEMNLPTSVGCTTQELLWAFYGMTTIRVWIDIFCSGPEVHLGDVLTYNQSGMPIMLASVELPKVTPIWSFCESLQWPLSHPSTLAMDYVEEYIRQGYYNCDHC